MNLAELTDGRTVLVDANILLYSVQRASAESAKFLEECARGAVTGLITSIVLAEFCHRRMMMEAHRAGFAASNPARVMAQSPEIIRKLSTYAEDVRDLLDSQLVFEPVQREDFILALELQRRHALLTNDSLNLAVGRRLGVRDIATADRNFDRVGELTIHRPSDIAI